MVHMLDDAIFFFAKIIHCNIAAIIALPLVAIIAGNIFSIAQPYLPRHFISLCEITFKP